MGSASQDALTVKFLSEFKDRYQRNNKRTGQKNLRCFPGCGDLGHMTSGFCGLPITCRIFGLGVHGKGSNPRIRTWGEFVVRGTDDEWKIGSQYKLEELKEKERSRLNPLRPWLRGDISNEKLLKHSLKEKDSEEESGKASNSVVVLFNQELLGWHYQWVSTKHTCDSLHSFKVHVFREEGDSLTYLGSGMSPQFQLYSRRRQRGAKVEANAGGVTSKRMKTDPSSGANFGPKPGVAPAFMSAGQKRPRPEGISNAVEYIGVTAPTGMLGSSLNNSIFNNSSGLGFGANHIGYFVQQQQNAFKQSIHQQLFSSFQAQQQMQECMNLNTMSSMSSQNPNITLSNFLDPQIASSGANKNTLEFTSARSLPNPAKIMNDMRLKRFVNALITEEVFNEGGKDQVQTCTDPGILPKGDTFEEIQQQTLTMARLMMFLIHCGGGGGVGGGLAAATKVVAFMNRKAGEPTQSGKRSRETNVEGYNLYDIMSDIMPSNSVVPTKPELERFKRKNSDLGETLENNLENSECNPIDRLRQAVLEHGSDAAKANIEFFVEVIEDFAKFLASEKSLSDDLSEFFKAWSSEAGLVKLMNEMKHEDKLQLVNPMVDLDAVWHAQMIKVYAKGGKGGSAFAQLRVIFFKNIKNFLESKNVVSDFFNEYMEIAAKSRILPVDPFVPPSPIAAHYAHLQIYGNADNLKDQDFGSTKGVFESPEQQCIWARAVFIIKRRLVRLAIINRVRQEHILNKQLKGLKMTPAPKDIDITGTWLRSDVTSPPIKILEEIIKQVSGIPIGNLFSDISTSIYKRIKVKISSEFVEVQGVSKLFSDAKMVVFLDGKPHEWNPPTPMPLRPALQEKEYCAWIDTVHGQHTVRFISGGSVSKRATGLLASINLPNSRPEFNEALKKNVKDGNDIHVRVAFECKQSTDGTTMYLKFSLFLYCGKESPPAIAREGPSLLFGPEESLMKMPSHYVTKYQTFFRILDDSDRVEELLRLIEE